MDLSSIAYQPYLPSRELARVDSARTESKNRSAVARRSAGGGRLSNPSGIKGMINRNDELYKVSQDFEAIFIKQMLNVMRKSVSKTGLMDGGMAEDIFEDMLYDEYAKKMAESGSFGIADMIYRQLNTGVS